MWDKIVRHIRKRRLWVRHSAALARVTSVPEFRKLLAREGLQPAYVSDGEEVSRQKREQIARVLDAYAIDVAGRRVLDIGPGFGDFLDVVRERGGIPLGVDYDPFVVRWLQVRGHLALRGNILRGTRVLGGQLFELINSTGSLVVEYFSMVGLHALRRLLADLERHLAPGGVILICPYFERGADGQRRIADPLQCPFTDTMKAAGYDVMPRLPGVHDTPIYALTYGKRLPPPAADTHATPPRVAAASSSSD